MSGAPTAGLTDFYVLVIEDEYLQAYDCCECLRGAGATIAGPVRSGADAKHILDQARVDAAVLDINLGQGPDLEIASQLAARGVPPATTKRLSRPGSKRAPTLQKPFDAQDLIIAVRSLR